MKSGLNIFSLVNKAEVSGVFIFQAFQYADTPPVARQLKRDTAYTADSALWEDSMPFHRLKKSL